MMNISQKLFILLSIFIGTTLPMEKQIQHENWAIALDLDKVTIKPEPKLLMYSKIIFKSILNNPRDIQGAIATLLHMKKEYTKNKDGVQIIYNSEGQQIHGLTPQLLEIGMRYPESTLHVARILKSIEESRQMKSDTVKILEYLNIPIIFATNKDCVSYEETTRVLGTKLTHLATKAIVTKQPLNEKVLQFAQEPTTATSYQTLAEEYHNKQATDNIIHAPGRKPEHAYYQCVEKVIGPDKNIIFIDDMKENVEGFNKLPSTSSAQRIGIQFKNPRQLTDELIKLGFLSEIKDQRLLEDIRYPGITGKMQLMSEKLLNLMMVILLN